MLTAAARRACAASAPRRPASWLQLQRSSTCGLMVYGLLRLHLGRSQPSVRTQWLCDCLLSLEELQVVAMPTPRKHAAMLPSMP